MIVVEMVQTSEYSWDIVSPKGYVLQQGIKLHNLEKAEEYIKAFISSYIGWDYKVVPLTK